MFTFLAFTTITATALSTPTATLSGTAQDSDGKPIAGATVLVRTAAPRQGTGALGPDYYPDCGKSVRTDDKGNFSLTGLDPNLLFRLLIVADGYVPKASAPTLDPAKSPMTFSLKPLALDKRGPKLVLQGRVHDENGAPVAGATVAPEMFMKGRTGSGGNLERKGFQPLAITDKDGRFQLAVPEDGITVTALVTAPRFAPRKIAGMAPGPKDNDVLLYWGVTVTGRVVKGGAPLAGVGVGLIPMHRQPDRALGHFKVATDENGNFTLHNVPPDEDCVLFGLMADLAAHGATRLRSLTTGTNGSEQEVGEIKVRPGVHLAGQVRMADGKPVPENTKVYLLRHEVQDAQTTTADKDGRFSFTGLFPGEVYRLYTARMNGYHVSEKNVSYDLLNGSALLGTVKADIDGFCLLMEPGRADRPARPDIEEYKRRKNSPLQGVPDEPAAKK
jgi:uncharacterized GH25 family protein